jgi:hypothetical protein
LAAAGAFADAGCHPIFSSKPRVNRSLNPETNPTTMAM